MLDFLPGTSSTSVTRSSCHCNLEASFGTEDKKITAIDGMAMRQDLQGTGA